MLKRDAKTLRIKEQMINDLTTGLMVLLRVTPDGEARIEINGDTLPLGNRSFQFDSDGQLVSTGTSVSGCLD